MSAFDPGALRYVFPEELLRYFDIVESGIHTDKPTGADYLEVVFEEKNTLPRSLSYTASHCFFSSIPVSKKPTGWPGTLEAFMSWSRLLNSF